MEQQGRIGIIIKDHFDAINQWIEEKRAGIAWPLYSSLDIRTSAFKSAHVDNNLFPAGFNNLAPESIELSKQLFIGYLSSNSYSKIVLVPENFTRNQGYIDNIITIYHIFCDLNFEVYIASPELSEAITISSSDGVSVKIYKLIKQDQCAYVNLSINDALWEPDLIILNNDLSNGLFEELSEIVQPILPNPKYGWYARRKSNHFSIYNELAMDFAQKFGIDAWLISTYTKKCKNINFRDKKGLSCLMLEADKMISAIGQKYKQYEIDSRPYVFLKADQGTFGMGITQIFQGEELLSINKKTRHSINTIKGGVLNSEVLIQEGIPTLQKRNDWPAEDVLYTVNGEVVGEITRFNEQKDAFSNLNSKGMHLIANGKLYLKNDLDYAKWLIAKLGNLSALYEYKKKLA